MSISTDGKSKNKIDHVVIYQSHYIDILDVRSYRVAECSSVHALVIAQVLSRVSSQKRQADKNQVN